MINQISIHGYKLQNFPLLPYNSNYSEYMVNLSEKTINELEKKYKYINLYDTKKK